MRSTSLSLALAVLVGAAPGLSACASSSDVTRVMGGAVVAGSFVPPGAYAAFLRGAMAEEDGQLAAAIEAYEEAAAIAGDDPAPWTGIGDARCRLSGSDPAADSALARALSLDPAYAPALEARARCEAARGQLAAARDDAARAAAADPLAADPALAGASASRDSLLGLTLIHATDPAAWEALAAWGAAHRDGMRVARALATVARLVPARKASIAAVAVRLAGDGEIVAARALAAALLDAPGDRSSGGEAAPPSADPLVSRLAIDEALDRSDIDAARRRAVRAHVGLDAVGGRALLAGLPALARTLVEPLVLGDPRATGARMVLATAALRGGDAATAARALESVRAAPSPEAVAPEAILAFASLLDRESSSDAAKAVLERFAPFQILPGDARETSIAVDLAARGLLRDEVLPSDARVELAARRAEAPRDVDASSPGLDARHRLFAWALVRPHDAPTLELARRLGPAATHDALIAAALARLALAGGDPDARSLTPIASLDPADPILASAALDLAKRSGDAKAIAPARARLTALARTASERAHALE